MGGSVAPVRQSPRLDLVRDEEHVVLVAEPAHALEVARARHDDAGLALDGLEHDLPAAARSVRHDRPAVDTPPQNEAPGIPTDRDGVRLRGSAAR